MSRTEEQWRTLRSTVFPDGETDRIVETVRAIESVCGLVWRIYHASGLELRAEWRGHGNDFVAMFAVPAAPVAAEIVAHDLAGPTKRREAR